MHALARTGLALGGLAAGGGAMYWLKGVGERTAAAEQARIDAQVSPARAEWTAWKAALDREFPGLRLDTTADHARLDEFLREHPAPAWVTVQHEDYTRIRIDATDSFLRTDRLSAPEQGDAYMVGFGGMFVLGGAGAAISGALRGASSLPGTIGMTLGGGAAVAFGVGSMMLGIDGFRTPAPQQPAWDLVREVDRFN